MNQHMTYLTKAILAATCLALGCGDSGTATPMVDSDLIGIWGIDTYQSSPFDPQTQDPIPDSCDQLSDAPPLGDFLVIYSFEFNDNLGEAALGAVFCNDIEQCQDVAMRAPEPLVGYSFITGSDDTEWVGFGLGRQGSSSDQCLIELQNHVMTASGDSIEITTNTVDVIFPPELNPEDPNDATCSIAEALRVFGENPDLPCESRFFLEATRSETQ